ncbi:hypothetical protein SCHIN_v1c01220 [Spiroplasma chinense]|uniref:Uncharacterized protein n=1 Tax=Spiroplasma chinense TaxID=216932 RepID=A0A5B9Y2R2_9MOLU|nr:hypothetical protein [Spiroplasma chinense]QEH61320.1 hypothetical protein SCHIN_v1c01220 [Spiroplasma chinense]
MKRLIAAFLIWIILMTTAIVFIAILGFGSYRFESSNSLKLLKNHVQRIVNENNNYQDAQSAASIVNENILLIKEENIFVEQEEPKSVDQVLFVIAKAKDEVIEVTYRPSKLVLNKTAQFVWCEENSFEQTLSLKENENINMSDQFVLVNDSIEVEIQTQNKEQDFSNLNISDDSLIEISVSKNILIIKGLKVGETNVTVNPETSNSFSFKVTVFEEEKEPEVLPIDNIDLLVDEVKEINIKVINIENPVFKLENQNKDITSAELNNNKIKLVGLKEGKSLITIQLSNYNQVSFEVFVSDLPSLPFVEDQNVFVNQSVRISIADWGVNNTDLTFESEDTSLFTLSSTSTYINITGIKFGNSSLKISTKGMKSTSFRVDVWRVPLIDKVESQEILVGETKSIVVMIANPYPQATFTVSSLDIYIAEVKVTFNNLLRVEFDLIGIYPGIVHVHIDYPGASRVVFIVNVIENT